MVGSFDECVALVAVALLVAAASAVRSLASTPAVFLSSSLLHALYLHNAYSVLYYLVCLDYFD